MATELKTPTTVDFLNEPLIDFGDEDNVRRMEAALATVRSEMGRTYPLIIGGREIHDGDVADSINPAHPEQVVGRFVQATVEHSRQAIDAADQAFPEWS
ncbi:MAG: L-glutamate gamma-semialdehyde dehydrogenase, partial [Longimicrobiales bacterium]